MMMESYETRTKREQYQAFIAAIDCTQAGADDYGNLAWHVDCSAQANACDMQNEQGKDATRYWSDALSTAEMIVDCWQDYYPQLIQATTKENATMNARIENGILIVERIGQWDITCRDADDVAELAADLQDVGFSRSQRAEIIEALPLQFASEIAALWA
jgi:uncharacterized UPF0160 family protein